MPELLVIFYNLYYFTLRIIEIDFFRKKRLDFAMEINLSWFKYRICHHNFDVVLMFIWSKGPYSVIEGLWPSQKLEGGACTALNF